MNKALPVSDPRNGAASALPSIPLARMRAAREIVAVVIAERGATALPILDRIEAEIAAALAAESAVDRARAIVAAGGRFRPAGTPARRKAA